MLNRILFPEGNCVSNVGFSLIPRSSPAHKSNSMNSNKDCRAKKIVLQAFSQKEIEDHI